MNCFILTAVVLISVLILSMISCSTRNRSMYWRDGSNALYSVMRDASESFKLAKNPNIRRQERRNYIERTIAFLDSAERFVTPVGIMKVVNIDAQKMRNACVKLQSRLA